MKYLFPFFLILVSIYVYSCANQGTPTGGPKDTIPPSLIETNPTHKSINFKGKEFTFVFDERVNADKIKSQLLITPIIENKYKVKIRKNELTLTFDDKFQDSTTYTLNFSEGLTDVTEKNPTINLTFAFSTGHYIDSIYVNGKITDLYTNKDQAGFLVGLYEITDSLDLLKDKPRYFAKTNKKGQFLIENIKNGFYKILCFNDENKNQILNPETEAHGFLSDSLNLLTSQDSIRIPTQVINASPLSQIRSKTTGRYFDIQFNKSFIEYTITKLDSNNQLSIPPNNRVKENKILRFYPIETYNYDSDSLGIIVDAIDSVYNHSIDTSFVKFSESTRKPDSFKAKFTPKNKTYIDPIINFEYQFNKPIASFDKDSILIQYDSLKSQTIPDSSIIWNENKTQLKFQAIVDKQYLLTRIDTLLKIYGDTSRTDSVSKAKYKYYSQVKTDQISIQIPEGSFISVEADSTEGINYTYSFNTLDELGSVSGEIITNHTHFTIQLVDTKYQVIEEIKNSSIFSFPYVKPGKYTFRVLIDEDQNGEWFYGNLLKDQTPEPIYFYSEIFDVRANWQLENIQITF